MIAARVATTAVAALLAAAPSGAPAAAAPSAAAASCDENGVTVVVDPHGADVSGSLRGRVRAICDPAGAGVPAARLFERNGFPLTDVARQPGFVCRVAGWPDDDPCISAPPADAYWSLWWSDGSSDWRYATTAADALTIPAGGLVAFSWDDVPGDAPPSPDPVGAFVSSTAREQGGDPAAPPAGQDGGLPAWLAPIVVVVLFGAAGGVAVARRRGRP